MVRGVSIEDNIKGNGKARTEGIMMDEVRSSKTLGAGRFHTVNTLLLGLFGCSPGL